MTYGDALKNAYDNGFITGFVLGTIVTIVCCYLIGMYVL